jgi:predicted small secreted protein
MLEVGFTSIGGQKRNYIAALDATTGKATDWNPNADSYVATLAINGSTIYVGGYFTSIGGQKRNYIAALDATTGKAINWNPDADNGVLTLAINGSTIYVGGYFTSIGGQKEIILPP